MFVADSTCRSLLDALSRISRALLSYCQAAHKSREQWRSARQNLLLIRESFRLQANESQPLLVACFCWLASWKVGSARKLRSQASINCVFCASRAQLQQKFAFVVALSCRALSCFENAFVSVCLSGRVTAKHKTTQRRPTTNKLCLQLNQVGARSATNHCYWLLTKLSWALLVMQCEFGFHKSITNLNEFGKIYLLGWFANSSCK